MWKKAAWVYLAIYVIGVSAININAIISKSRTEGFDYSSIIAFILFLVPAVLIGLELMEKKVFVLFHIIALLFVAIMVLGIFNFNTVGLEMIGKALLFIPMLGCLGYYVYKHLTPKKKPAANA